MILQMGVWRALLQEPGAAAESDEVVIAEAAIVTPDENGVAQVVATPDENGVEQILVQGN